MELLINKSGALLMFSHPLVGFSTNYSVTLPFHSDKEYRAKEKTVF
jgi:hypothetical protein